MLTKIFLLDKCQTPVTGTRCRYFETGLLEEEAEYVRDVLNGFVTQYNSDGTVRVKREYKKGFPIEIEKEIRRDEKEDQEEKKEEVVEQLTQEELDRLL